MKTTLAHILFVLIFIIDASAAHASPAVLRFAWLSDTHIGDPTGAADLRASVKDINAQSNLSFVIISGDVTQFGSHKEFHIAKSLLDQLKIPYHAEPGNHDCKWSESGATEFATVFGSDRFVFNAGGYCFIGLHEGPIMKMGDGHFSPQDVRWLKTTLASLPPGQPVIFVTHYPLNDQLDNWFVVLDELKKYNIQAILVGHGHRNMKLNFEGVPAVMGRANLRSFIPHSSPPILSAGYTVVQISNQVMTITEKNPGRPAKAAWDKIILRNHHFAAATHSFPRPDFSVNSTKSRIREKWQFDAKWTVASSPAISGHRVFVGDASGVLRCLSLASGRQKWEFATGGPIYSTPTVAANKVVFASTDGSVYALKTSSGKLLWRYTTTNPIVASPAILSNVVYIGSSDGTFRALDLKTGQLKWKFSGIGDFVETRPLVTNGEVIFGAWDEYLYALDSATGALRWKWKGTYKPIPGVNVTVVYSPAAFWPVEADNKVFVVAPDRAMTALDAATGKQIWRTRDYMVRESIGISADASRFYVRTMTNTSIIAFSTTAAKPTELWTLHTPVNYDINSAMLEENRGVVYYGTKNGQLFAVDGKTGQLLWQYRLGVSILNTVATVPNSDDVVVADADGKITRLGPGKF